MPRGKRNKEGEPPEEVEDGDGEGNQKVEEEAKPKKSKTIKAVCEICHAKVTVPNLQKNACPACGHAGLVAA